MKILFVNTPYAQCGVHQYGENLYAVLQKSGLFETVYAEFEGEEQLRVGYHVADPDCVIYNWQQLIGGWMGGAPFLGLGKQVLVYHDLDARFQDFHAILFSDPTMAPHENWHPIGRPLNFVPITFDCPTNPRVVVGVNGLVGAWAAYAVTHAIANFPQCHLRLLLPASTFCDPMLHIAGSMASQCTAMAHAAGCTISVEHTYLNWKDLIQWLSHNDINCYVRDVVPWRGVSSILDAALCARRPIAINRCPGFRHLHDCVPSICIEDRPMTEILKTGTAPLAPKYEQFDPLVVAQQVKTILENC